MIDVLLHSGERLARLGAEDAAERPVRASQLAVQRGAGGGELVGAPAQRGAGGGRGQDTRAPGGGRQGGASLPAAPAGPCPPGMSAFSSAGSSAAASPSSSPPQAAPSRVSAKPSGQADERRAIMSLLSGPDAEPRAPTTRWRPSSRLHPGAALLRTLVTMLNRRHPRRQRRHPRGGHRPLAPGRPGRGLPPARRRRLRPGPPAAGRPHPGRGGRAGGLPPALAPARRSSTPTGARSGPTSWPSATAGPSTCSARRSPAGTGSSGTPAATAEAGYDLEHAVVDLAMADEVRSAMDSPPRRRARRPSSSPTSAATPTGRWPRSSTSPRAP